jgi:two-component system, OmpR family, alkaline phosphatase synthesis response regulator PhoP
MSDQKIVLIVDDDNLLRTVLRDLLEEAGFSAREAKNGEEGLQMALLEKPDLIILDLVMPIMDGMEMYTKMREDARGANIPVVMLTSAVEKNIRSWLNEQGLDYFNKDRWTMDAVVNQVKQRLSGAANENKAA